MFFVLPEEQNSLNNQVLFFTHQKNNQNSSSYKIVLIVQSHHLIPINQNFGEEKDNTTPQQDFLKRLREGMRQSGNKAAWKCFDGKGKCETIL